MQIIWNMETETGEGKKIGSPQCESVSYYLL